MRVGELARQVGVSTDTVRFYEHAGWLPQAARRANAYRDYAQSDVDHLRLLIELRRLDLPLADAARLAGWCHSGHCADTSSDLPQLVADRRADIARRMAGLAVLDARLASLQAHISGRPLQLAFIGEGGACCSAAGAVLGSDEGGCPCCTPSFVDGRHQTAR